MRVLSWINFVLGLWLIAAAWILSARSGPVMTEEIAIGIVIAAFAFFSTVHPTSPISWIVVLGGLWSLVAPSLINYSAVPSAKTNDVVVGLVVIVLGFANAVYRRSPARTAA